MEIFVEVPSRLYSPHTIFLRKSGTSYELATALASLLIGSGYDAYVVSGYATRDVTLKIMTRINSPYPEFEEKVDDVAEEVIDPKYVLKAPRDLRSKFLMMMEQREVDKVNNEKERIEEEKRLEIEEMEKPPFDELFGLRVHAWVLLRPGKRDIEEPVFIESSTGYVNPVATTVYCGVESVWNHENYWVNMQDCANGIANMEYDLTNGKKWEHLLLGEPVSTREAKLDADMEDEEILLNTIYQEKHLDMPTYWSSRIDIPHDVIEKRFPNGIKTTCYKRSIVEQYAPYVHDIGLVTRISRFHDLECSPDQLYQVEDIYMNRHDRMCKIVDNMTTGWREVHFLRGREDAIRGHKYNVRNNEVEAPRVIEYFHENRFDSMEKLELDALFMTETYVGRDDKFSYRHVKYAKRGHPPPGYLEGPRRIVLLLVEKFDRDETKNASDDIAMREFDIIDKEIRIKYHYDKGKVTASTRKFTKPPMAEMSDRLVFDPSLTSGYQAEIGATPPRQLKLFTLLDAQLKAEKESLRQIREIEDLTAEFVKLRDLERTLPNLDVSIFNREQNIEYRQGMLEREQQQKQSREKEVEEDTDFLAPYLARFAIPILNRNQALDIEIECLNDFKKMMVARAVDIQRQFEKCSNEIQDKQAWYTTTLDTITLLEEENYFKEINDARFLLHTLQMRLIRHRELSGPRYEALVKYLRYHPQLAVLYGN